MRAADSNSEVEPIKTKTYSGTIVMALCTHFASGLAQSGLLFFIFSLKLLKKDIYTSAQCHKQNVSLYY